MTLLEKLTGLGLTLNESRIAIEIYRGSNSKILQLMDALGLTFQQVEYSKKKLYLKLGLHSKKQITEFVSMLNVGVLNDIGDLSCRKKIEAIKMQFGVFATCREVGKE